jgi:uncharacterized membrane protein YgdD (TMEM256/DUF423 family)
MKAFRIAGIAGFLGVALGAFGAHGLKATFEANGTAAIWLTASTYHLLHAIALLALASAAHSAKGAPGAHGSQATPAFEEAASTGNPGAAFWFFLAGIAIFSGSLYTLAITNIRWLGAITPIGGLCFLAGWLSIAWRGFGRER